VPRYREAHVRYAGLHTAALQVDAMTDVPGAGMVDREERLELRVMGTPGELGPLKERALQGVLELSRL
jgi:hypothetical protein